MKKILAAVLGLLLLSGCGIKAEEYTLDAAAIESTTRFLCETIGIREVGTAAEAETCRYLEDRLEELGFCEENNTLLRQKVTCKDGRSSENLVAVCNAGNPGPIVVALAHYDSVSTSPGAGDNAVSVGILLEVAGKLRQSAPDYPGEIRLVFAGAEENGFHGSRCYLEQQTQQDLARHLGCFNMDISAGLSGQETVLVCNTQGVRTGDGYREGNFIEPVDNAVSLAVARAYRELYGGSYGGACHVGNSDHVSFHNLQIDAANTCWRVLENGEPVLPDTYHKMTDTPDTLDYDTAAKTGACVLRGMQILLENNK